jgi:excisionase family DNA binding protein
MLETKNFTSRSQKQVFTNFEEQELRDLIKECIESTLGVTLSQPAPSPAKATKLYYTRNETADLLHLSLPTLGKMTKEGRIKGHRLGGKVLYKFTDIEDALKEMRVRGN